MTEPMELAFTVQSIDCIACSPYFGRSLGKIDGVLAVKEHPITNKIVVSFDSTRIDRISLKREVEYAAKKSGLGNKIIFQL